MHVVCGQYILCNSSTKVILHFTITSRQYKNARTHRFSGWFSKGHWDPLITDLWRCKTLDILLSARVPIIDDISGMVDHLNIISLELHRQLEILCWEQWRTAFTDASGKKECKDTLEHTPGAHKPRTQLETLLTRSILDAKKKHELLSVAAPMFKRVQCSTNEKRQSRRTQT